MLRRRNGFTLIELLVVIAIIGILAAMLFPVFARAPESARKIRCLSNVKNIAMAFQVYFADYDRFPPAHTDQAALDTINAASPRKLCGFTAGSQFWRSNPFLRWPVILEEYIKNREVWRCPSARNAATFQIMNPFLNSTGKDDWFLRFKESLSHLLLHRNEALGPSARREFPGGMRDCQRPGVGV